MLTRNIKINNLIKLNKFRSFSSASSSANNLVLVDVDDKTGYATLSLNRPPVNSINLDLIIAFDNALIEIEKNKSRGLILTSVNIQFKIILTKLKNSFFRQSQKYSPWASMFENFTNRIMKEFVSFGALLKVFG